LTRAGRGASGGGEEALEGWNLGGVDQPWRNPARSAAVGSVVARGKKGKQARKSASVVARGKRGNKHRSALLRRREGEGEQSRG
jgi:hypothetical protein